MSKKASPSKWIELFFPSPIRKLRQHSEIMELCCDFTIAAVVSSQYPDRQEDMEYFKNVVRKLIIKAREIRNQMRTSLHPYHVMPILNSKKIVSMLRQQDKMLDASHKVVSLLQAISYAPVSPAFQKKLFKLCVTSIAPCRTSNELLLELMETATSSYIFDNKNRLVSLLDLIETRSEAADLIHTELVTYLYKQGSSSVDTMFCLIWTKIISSLADFAHLASGVAHTVKSLLEEN